MIFNKKKICLFFQKMILHVQKCGVNVYARSFKYEPQIHYGVWKLMKNPVERNYRVKFQSKIWRFLQAFRRKKNFENQTKID